MRAVPAPEGAPLRVGGDDGVEGEPDPRGGDRAPDIGDVGERPVADRPAHHDVRVPNSVLDHVVVAERAQAEDALVVRVQIVHGVDRLRVHVPARVAAAGVDGEAQVLRGVAHVLVEPRAADGGRRIADGAVVVQGGLDEAVAGRACHPFPGHRLADVGREGRVLDVVAGGDEVLDLIVEKVEVEHPVHVVTEGEHALVGAEGAQTRVPEGLEPDLEEKISQEEEQRVAPVRGVGPVSDRFHVQVRLEHAAHELEHLVGHVRGAVGEDDGGAHGGRGRRGRSGQIARQLHEVGKNAATRRGLDPLYGVAGKAAHVEALPGRVREGGARPPAPPCIAGDGCRRAGGQSE